MYCPNCQAKVKKKDNFCYNCGTVFEDEETVKSKSVNKTNKPIPKENTMAEVMSTTGKLVIILSAIVGLFIANIETGSGTEFSFVIYMAVLISGIISGIFFMGLGEIIELLHKIHYKMPKDTEEIEE